MSTKCQPLGDQGDGHHCPVDAELTWSGSGRLSAMASETDPETGKTSGIQSVKFRNLSPISQDVVCSIGSMVTTSKKLPHKNEIDKLWQTSHLLRAVS